MTNVGWIGLGVDGVVTNEPALFAGQEIRQVAAL